MCQSTFAPTPSHVRNLLRLCPAYFQTPIIRLDGHAPAGILLKDETSRMGLGSFKALGGVYAVYRLIADAWERERGQPLNTSELFTLAVKDFASNLVFVCASAGNHGLSVAAGAKLFGAKARIHLANNVPKIFAKALQVKDAEVVWSGDVYEQSMTAAAQDAVSSGAILLADGSWPGYAAAPLLVMEGYTVIAEEMRETFEASGQWPTHLALQAGVGGLAAAIAHMVRRNWAVQPELIVVEPESAACLGESHKAGQLVRIEGPASNMGRLDCKEASQAAFEALNRCDVQYAVISDQSAQSVVESLKTRGIQTTPSGAAGIALITELGLPAKARPLAIISEGSAN